jgi:PAS domain S-box-containing protein
MERSRQSPQSGPREGNRGGSVRVLLVDDNPDVAEAGAEFLERENERFVIQTALGARKGLETVDSTVDCIVSDYEMPGLDGIEFLEAVRERYPELPFILFTGRGSETVASDAISAGVTDYLQKGSGTDQYTLLANRVLNAVERRRTSEKLEATRDRYNALRTKLTELSVALLESRGTDIDARIERALEQLGVHTAADRSYVFEIDREEETLSNTHEWCAEDVTPQIDSLQGLQTDTFSWWIRQLESSGRLIVPDVSALPDEAGAERELLEAQNIECLIVHPMTSGDELVGFVGFDWVEKRELWSEELTDILGMAARLIRSALEQESRRRELERREAYLEQSGDVISVLGSSGEIRYQNASTEAVTGFSPAEVMGQSGFEHLHPEDRQRVGEEFPEFVSNPGQRLERELRVEAKDGSWRWIEVQGVNMLDDPVVNGLLFSSRDITERKRREQEIRRQNERLDEFAGFVSHELRNPLTVAQGRIELAAGECDSQHLDAAARGVDRGLELIDDLSLLASTDPETDEMDAVELSGAVRTCWEPLDTADATVTAEVTGAIRADRSQLHQLLKNLFRNAVEHGGTGVSVEVRSVPGGFAVADNGTGISADDPEDVFETGYSGSKSDGTGFGLAIVRQIVAAHGWELNVTDSAAGGARFEVTGVTFVDG